MIQLTWTGPSIKINIISTKSSWIIVCIKRKGPHREEGVMTGNEIRKIIYDSSRSMLVLAEIEMELTFAKKI